MAFAQTDLKKVLAYSTVSQLGFMFVGVGTGNWSAGVFHLMTHAFFKAGLFLGAGSVMHGMEGSGDIRIMGGLKKYMPITRMDVPHLLPRDRRLPADLGLLLEGRDPGRRLGRAPRRLAGVPTARCCG
jgi:hypothetical protein